MHKYFKLKCNLNKKVKYYVCGFFLSILLTIIPFIITKNGYFSYFIHRFTIIFCAIFQIIVHFICFLHLNNIKKNFWYLISLLFVLVIIFIVVFGSIWIMFNLNHHVLIK
ncbi:Cytochrome bo(3) ubiquinol oxidase subunit 4 [Buchnera aphidicola (Protaphis terricola)]|uniref:cytochrome o ubiquinol oxidase subunit IV n=1 Tax=Buchnera aphidicola TaxID=9 RepID=UPI0034646968